jgi:DNA modification methylase
MQRAAIGTIIPNPTNPRIIKDDKFKKLVKSIQEFPQMLELRPIVVDGNMVVLGGNMRLKACIAAGLKEVPIIIADQLTDAQKGEFIIKDNVGFGEWDWDLLANEWDVETLQDWGLELPFDNTPVLEAEEDDYEAPSEIKTDVVLGDLIEIGNHRLLCGDSTDSDQVAKLMNGEKADLAHNDPPYGMKKENDGVLNDNLNYDDLLEFNEQWIPLQFSHLKENGSWYCWGIDEPLMDIYSNIIRPYQKEGKLTFRNLITWFKNPSGLGDGQNNSIARSYGIITEKCLFLMLGVEEFNNNADNYFDGFDSVREYLMTQRNKMGWSSSDIIEITGKTTASHYFSKSQWSFPTREHYDSIRAATNGAAFHKDYDTLREEYEKIKKEYDLTKKEYYSTRAHFNNTHDKMTEVWQFDRHKRDGTEGGHATPKPILLCERVIKSSSPDGGLVIDSFMGSGSTMVAAHQLNRKCYGMELDPKYCQVIIDRMHKLDPSFKIKINGKPYDK